MSNCLLRNGLLAILFNIFKMYFNPSYVYEDWDDKSMSIKIYKYSVYYLDILMIYITYT